MGILSGDAKDQPMHYGEIIGCWAFMGANNGLVSAYEAFINQTGDKDLVDFLKESVKMMRSEATEVGKLLIANGIAVPPTLPERPSASLDDIPVGVRFMDPEISGAVSMNVGQGLVSCSQVMGQCLREDIAVMFGKFHMERAKLGGKLLALNKEKGWIIPPPLHTNISKKE